MDIRHICNFVRVTKSERSRLWNLSWWVKNWKLFWESPHHAHSFNFMNYAIYSWTVFALQIYLKVWKPPKIIESMRVEEIWDKFYILMIYCSLFCLIYFIDSHLINKLTFFIQVMSYSRTSKNLSLGMLMSAKSDTFITL